MNTTRLIITGMFIAMLGHSIQGNAEDIDLYSSPFTGGADLPNVLFVLDNAANWNASVDTPCTYGDGSGSPSLGQTTGGIEQCALVDAISALPADTVNIGIMFYNTHDMHEEYGCNSSGTGGCLMFPLTAMTAAGKNNLITKIKGWDAGVVQANNEATAQGMQEAWAYYGGRQGMSGTTYTSPLPAGGCAKNFVIFIGNAINNSGSPGDGSASPGARLATTITGNTALTAAQKTQLNATIQIPAGAYGTSAFTCDPSNYTMPNHTEVSGLYADEWARYMDSVDLSTGAMPADKKIITYTVGVLSSQCKAAYPALLTSMAIKGGGKYFPTSNTSELQQAILQVLNEIQAVNSVFSSSSLPVSINTQGTFLNQIFVGMFRPDGAGVPRWNGNLKQYQFGYNSTTQQLFLADATLTPALSTAGTGFLSPNAASFWTCSNAANPILSVPPYSVPPYSSTCISTYGDPAVGFWANMPNGVGLSWDLPDGEIVEKGGAAQMLRLANLTDTYTAAPGSAANPRKLYTYCPSGTGCAAALTNSDNVFDYSNDAITDGLLGTGSIAISSITSAATVSLVALNGEDVTPGLSGAAETISITNLSKSGNTVTATVSAADLAKLSSGTLLNIATGAAKYDCNPCTVTATNSTTNTFTYAKSGGGGTPSLPSTATVYTRFVTVDKIAHGLAVGQMVTFSNCLIYNNAIAGNLNGTTATVSAVNSANRFTAATTVPLVGILPDTACRYTPNTATVTTSAAHGLPSGSSATIAGASCSPTSCAGYNGSWVITATGSSTFTYQYTVAAPLPNFTGAGATVTSSSTTREALLRWVRGEDNFGDEASLCPPGSTAGTGNCPNTIPMVNIRPSVHGDVLHSRPVVINYGGTTGVVVYYGDNGGVFHAVNGNQTNPTGSTMPTPGSELWGFIPSDFFGKLKRQHDNSPVLSLPSTPPGIIPTPLPKDYFVDGPTGVYQKLNADGTTQLAYLYLAMRRGGRTIYALDVSNPASPQFLWKHSSADTDTVFGELGQTWSLPKVAVVKGYTTNPVLIFGAGYDAAAEDAEPPTANTMGRGIFILDAVTGNRVWSSGPSAGDTACSGTTTQASCQVSGMNYSIPSDISLMDHDGDGFIDRMYVGDLGGNVWRVDLEPTGGNTPDFWQVKKLAALGCTGGTCSAGTAPRKIFYPPEVISTAGYDAVFTATGDREHPLYSATAGSACQVLNRAYFLQDNETGKDGSSLVTITETDLHPATNADPYTSALSSTHRGYYVTFDTLSAANPTYHCEKAVNAPLVVAGSVFFGTNLAVSPPVNQCVGTLGKAFGYTLSPFSGHVVIGEFEGGGLPPSPMAGVVTVRDVVTGRDVLVPFCIGCVGGSALAGSKPLIDFSTTRSRTYWYLKDK